MTFTFPRSISVSSEPAKHPWIKAPRHPTVDRPGRNGSVGTEITCFHPYGDSVLVGYGDWDINSGPVDIWSINPETLEWSLESEKLPTESVDKIVTLGDTTIALHTDPLGYYVWNDNKVGTIIGSQEQMTGNRVIHAFDAVELPDGSWWFVGSGWETEASDKDRAMGFLTRDRGKTWEHYVADLGQDHYLPRFQSAKVIDGLPAAYENVYGWQVLRDGNFEPVGDMDLGSVAINKEKIPGNSSYISATITCLGYTLYGTSAGDVWVRKEV